MEDKAAKETPVEEPKVDPETPAAAEETSATEVSPSGTPAPLSDSALPQEPVDASERSRLGRKVKEAYDKIDMLEGEIKYLRNRFLLIRGDMGTETTDIPAMVTDDEMPLTEKSAMALIQKVEKQKKDAVETYKKAYVSQIDRLVLDEEDEALAREFSGEVFNMPDAVYSTSDVPTPEEAKADAERNYLMAVQRVLKKKVVQSRTPTNPLKGEPPRAPLGVSAQSRVPSTPLPPVKLPPDALEYAKKVGMSEDKIREALAGEIPNVVIKGAPK